MIPAALDDALDGAASIVDLITPPMALSGLYAALGFLLLSLQLKSGWSWPVKAAAIGLALPATLGAHLAIQAQLGWPSATALPARFQLHAALIEEPASAADRPGAIYLWITPWPDVSTPEKASPTGDAAREGDGPATLRPRAFDLPYTRELHRKIESMRARLARGEMIIGRHEAGSGWRRRFGQSGGQTRLEAPPPPPLPAKEG